MSRSTYAICSGHAHSRLSSTARRQRDARFAGIATFMRLPGTTAADQLDAAVIGVPFDIGTSNRPGARFGPRGIRNESVLLRPYNMATRAAPFDSLRIDDLGDVATNPYNVADSMDRIEAFYRPLLEQGLMTVTMGGDHTIILPILRAMAAKHGPSGWCTSTPTPTSTTRCSANASLTEHPFRRPSRKGCSTATASPRSGSWHGLPGRRLRLVAPAGLPRGAGRGVLASQPRSADGRRSAPSSARGRSTSASTSTVSIRRSPGTGTPEIGGLTIWQGMEIIRGCRGLNLVGATSSRWLRSTTCPA